MSKGPPGTRAKRAASQPNTRAIAACGLFSPLGSHTARTSKSTCGSERARLETPFCQNSRRSAQATHRLRGVGSVVLPRRTRDREKGNGTKKQKVDQRFQAARLLPIPEKGCKFIDGPVCLVVLAHIPGLLHVHRDVLLGRPKLRRIIPKNNNQTAATAAALRE